MEYFQLPWTHSFTCTFYQINTINLKLELNPKIIMLNFEHAMTNAVTKVFLRTILNQYRNTHHPYVWKWFHSLNENNNSIE